MFLETLQEIKDLVIAKLWGTVAYIDTETVILDVGSVGYSVMCATPTLRALSAAQGTVSLWIETIFRAESLRLFGFLERQEQECFRLLLTVQGVGARMALSLLSTFSTKELCALFYAQDKKALTRAEGVGAKIAARLIVELKDKFDHLWSDGSAPLPAQDPLTEDAVSALLHLGFGLTQIQQALNQIPPRTDRTLEDTIRGALRLLKTDSRE